MSCCNPMGFGLIEICILLIGCLFLFASCQTTSPREGKWDGTPETVIESHRGQVLVLLMGMETCNGTAAAMEVLKEYAAKKPRNVSIARIDVAPPLGELKPANSRFIPFEYGTDEKRILAEKLDFFYYPTLYIFGPEGELRYSGGCDKETLIKMASEILSEKERDNRHIYTTKMPEIGTKAPAFSGVTLDGGKITLGELQGRRTTALIFAKTKCRFTMAAFAGMKELRDTFEDKEVAVVIINRGETFKVIQPIYKERAPGVTVIHDKTGEITKLYGITAVPFLYILDGEGNIAACMPYTKETAENNIKKNLGIAVQSETTPAQGGG